MEKFRARFVVEGVDDYRPITWPVEFPYWCTGYNSDGDPIVVAYVGSEEKLLELWPEATEIELGDPVEELEFSGRFPKPDWFEASDLLKEGDAQQDA